MKRYIFIILSCTALFASAQSRTQCWTNGFGEMTCDTKPTQPPAFLDLGAFSRGANQANQANQQQQMFDQQMRMQQQMLQQQEQIRLQHELQMRLQEEQQIKQWQARQIRQEQEQRYLMEQVQQAQQQLEKQARLKQEKQILMPQSVVPKNKSQDKLTTEWQIGELYSSTKPKEANGHVRCFYQTTSGFIVVKGNKYPGFEHYIPSNSPCPSKLHISKFTGRACTASCEDGSFVSPFSKK